MSILTTEQEGKISVSRDDATNKGTWSGAYGFELLLDLHGCDHKLFCRTHIDQYFTDLCELIQMQKCEVHFWDDVGVPLEDQQTLPHTKGTSAVCFILTSSIVIHTLDLLRSVYVNVFSCKPFDPSMAANFTREFFRAENCNKTFIERTLQGQPWGENYAVK